MSILADFVALFYPQVCAACNGELLKGEEFICVDCQLTLPYTGFENQHPNPAEQMFWGRVAVETATSFLVLGIRIAGFSWNSAVISRLLQ